MDIRVGAAHGSPKSLTMEDVWGKWDSESLEMITKGMVVARGLPSVSKFNTEDDIKRIIAKTYPKVCPIWNDELPYKSVTVICDENQVEEVSYWMEYVLGGGAVSDMLELPNNTVALRGDYMCW